MELREFVAKTLTEIAQGVRDAQTATQSLGVRINQGHRVTATAKPHRKDISVEFHVAVTETEGTGTNAKIGVLGGFLGATASGDDQISSSNETSG